MFIEVRYSLLTRVGIQGAFDVTHCASKRWRYSPWMDSPIIAASQPTSYSHCWL